jgi:TetR/AcrR family transcriptional regulator, regulator of biofilm formation and stress response
MVGAMGGEPRTLQPRGVRRRDELLRAALRVIGERGLGAATHRAIAEAADVPSATTTYYFASLDELLEEALRLFAREEVARLRALADALAAAGGVTPAEAAAVFAQELTRGRADEPAQIAQFELYIEAARRPALRAAAGECLDAYAAVAEAAMRAAGAREPAEAARAGVALVDGTGLDAIAGGAERSADELRRALLALFRGYLELERATPRRRRRGPPPAAGTSGPCPRASR